MQVVEVVGFPPDAGRDLGVHVVFDLVRAGGDVVFGDGGEAGGVLCSWLRLVVGWEWDGWRGDGGWERGEGRMDGTNG